MKTKFIILAPDDVEFQLQRVPGMDNVMMFETTDDKCSTFPIVKKEVVAEVKQEETDLEGDINE